MAFVVQSTKTDTADAVVEVASAIHQRRCSPESPALVFASAQHARDPEALRDALFDALPVPFVGWVGASAFANLRINERKAGISVLVLDELAGYSRAVEQQGLGAHVVAGMLADAPLGRARFLASPPAGLDAHNFLRALDEQAVPMAGALSIAPPKTLAHGLGGRAPKRAGETPIATLLSIDGAELVTAISIGARACGEVRTITKANRQVALEIDGRPALEALLADAPDGVTLARTGRVLAGLTDRDDDDVLLLRQIAKIDPNNGALTLADPYLEGRQIAFCSRDPQSARADLEETLFELAEEIQGRELLATVLFTCASRDDAHLGTPLYDVGRAMDLVAGDTPVVGVASSGQFATYGVKNHLFGYSCVVCAILR